MFLSPDLNYCDEFFFFSSRRRHTRYWRDWSSDVCSSDLDAQRYSQTDVVVLGLFAIGLSGLLIDALLRTAENRLIPWRGPAYGIPREEIFRPAPPSRPGPVRPRRPHRPPPPPRPHGEPPRLPSDPLR